MKILYIANARIPTEKAHGIQIMQMCAIFSNYDVSDTNKIEVELVIPGRFNWIKEDPFEYYGVKRNFKIKKLPCLDLIPLYKYIGHLGLWIESASFNFFAFPYIFFKKADIIYTRDKFLLPLSFLKKNLIFEAHTFPKNYILYSPFLKRLKRIIVITQKLKSLFVKQGMPQDKILVAPDGVDLEKFDIKEIQVEYRKKLNLPLDKKIVLYTGHLYEWKGATVLFEAARNFQFSISNSQFIFVGGTEKDIVDFRKQARDLNNVMIIGHRPHSEIPYWLKAADVLVLPNSGKEEISKYWTSPMKMFEYMASKRPIVASDLPSIREILNKENSVLVEPDNPGALARGIQKILEDKELAERITAKAFESVQRYSWQERAKRIYEYFSNTEK